MARSVWKGPYCSASLLRVVSKMRGKKTIIKTQSRSSMIVPDFVGLIFHVHNGKKYIPVQITDDMIGHKLGEFSPTRTYYGHSVDKKVVRK